MRKACSCIPGHKRHFLSKNPFASQKPVRKIRFAERTCAKKEDETLLEKGFTEKEKMMREVDVEMEKGEVAFNRSRTDGHAWDKKEIKSEVENTLTLGCFLNDFSCAQIGQSSFNAMANKSMSS